MMSFWLLAEQKHLGRILWLKAIHLKTGTGAAKKGITPQVLSLNSQFLLFEILLLLLLLLFNWQKQPASSTKYKLRRIFFSAPSRTNTLRHGISYRAHPPFQPMERISSFVVLLPLNTWIYRFNSITFAVDHQKQIRETRRREGGIR